MEKIISLLEYLGGFNSPCSKPIISIHLHGKRNIDLWFNFTVDNKFIIDIQYLPLEERIYDGEILDLNGFQELILKTKLCYLMEDYYSKIGEFLIQNHSENVQQKTNP